MKKNQNGNNVTLCGRIIDKFVSFRNRKKVVVAHMAVKRESGTEDIIPVVVEKDKLIGLEYGSEHLLTSIDGALCTYNDNNRHLRLYVFAYSIAAVPKIAEINIVKFDGYVCKSPKHRKTPKNRVITDIMVAINHKRCTSYIPTIAWERNANKSAFWKVGTHIQCSGRIQSRTYTKVTEDGMEDRVAYEVSLSAIEVVKGEIANE